MNIEERLRDSFAQRAHDVEVTPGALFEIQRRLAQRRRVPALRLRPALVLAAAACAAIAIVVSVSGTGPDPAPQVETATPPVAGTAAPPVTTPPTADPSPTPQSPTPAPTVAAPDTPQDGSGQIATTSPPQTPEPPPAQAAASSPDPTTVTEPEQATSTDDTETPVCPTEPESDGESLEISSEWVTVYFACGDSDAVPRLRPAASNDLGSALEILLGGPDETDIAAGFTGLSSGTTTAATATTVDKWVAVDLPAGLATGLGSGDGNVTAQQFLAQLNATVFQFSDFEVAEYRLAGDCAAFGALLGRSCEVHTRDGDGYAGHTSELTAHTIGNMDSVIRAEPGDAGAELGFLADGSRLTAGRSGAWAEIITTGGDTGWVSTQTIVAQPLTLDDAARETMANRARQITTGPGLDAAAFTPAGLVLRWGAGDGDVAVVSTAGATVNGEWWYRPLDAPPPRDGSDTASMADLLWIDGNGDGATVTINTPGPLGEPHGDFDSLAYVSIYRAVIENSILPPELNSTPTTTQAPATEGSDLPPTLPTPPEETADATDDTEPLRAQISIIFDFLSPGGPQIAAVEAIWIEP